MIFNAIPHTCNISTFFYTIMYGSEVQPLPLIQDDIEIPIPHYFMNENSRVLKERDKMLGTILARKGPLDTAEVNLSIQLVILN